MCTVANLWVMLASLEDLEDLEDLARPVRPERLAFPDLQSFPAGQEVL